MTVLRFRWDWLVPATAAFMVGIATLGYNPGALTTLDGSIHNSEAIAQPDLSTYLAPHSPHNALALNDATFASTTPAPSHSTHGSLWETNTVRP